MNMRSLPFPLAVLLTLGVLQCTKAADSPLAPSPLLKPTPPSEPPQPDLSEPTRSKPAPSEPPQPDSPLTEGRVVDEKGVGVAGVTLRLWGAGQPKVEGKCCGNYRVMDYAYTDSEGRFSKDLYFIPSTVSVDTVPKGFALPSEEVPLTRGQPVEVKLLRIP